LHGCSGEVRAAVRIDPDAAGLTCTLSEELQAQIAPPHDWTPVAFNGEVRESIGAFTDIANTVFKPAGEGPFPAVVLMHTCGGLKGAPNAYMKQHAQELLEAGHVVLVIDSYGPRGFDNCAARAPSGSGGIADAYAALALLAAKPFVDGARIYQVGYSWGAFIPALLASPQSARLAGSERRFTATVANYGSCAFKGSWDKSGQASRGYVFNPSIAKDATARLLTFMAQTR